MKNAFAINNNLILEAYKQGQGLRDEVNNGFAKVAQKTTLVGLKVLADCHLEGRYVPKGSLAYLPEDLLMTQAWAKQIKKADFVEQDFIVVESRHIIAISEEVVERA